MSWHMTSVLTQSFSVPTRLLSESVNQYSLSWTQVPLLPHSSPWTAADYTAFGIAVAPRQTWNS